MRTALIVKDNYRSEPSGVASFIRSMLPLQEREDIDFKVVEVADSGAKVDSQKKSQKPQRAKQKLNVAGVTQSQRPYFNPSVPFRGHCSLFLGYLQMLMRDIKQLRPLRSQLSGRLLLVNEYGCETLPIAARLLFPFHKIVAIAHTHPDKTVKGRMFTRRLVEWVCDRCVNDVIFNSESLQEEWRQKLAKRKRRGSVIYYGIEAPDLSLPDDYPEKPAGCVDFVCVSRFVRWKGHRELLTAFAKLKDNISQRRRDAERREPQINTNEHESDENPTPDTSGVPRLILVGDGPELEPSMKYARELRLNVYDLRNGTADTQKKQHSDEINRIDGINDSEPFVPSCGYGSFSVFFMGSRENGARYFNGGDVGIQLSIEAEAFGQVFVEAGQRGLPVIATRIGGIPEAVEDGVSGILVGAGDSRVASSAMFKMLDYTRRTAMGLQGRKRFRKYFTVTGMQTVYIKYITSAVMS